MEWSHRAVRQACREKTEDMTVPEAVKAYARGRAGKRITVRDESGLEAATGVKWHLRRQYGMTHIETDDYFRGRDGPGAVRFTFLLCHTEASVEWPSEDEIERLNAHHLEGARERNKARQALLDCDTLPSAIGEMAEAMVELAGALERVEQAKRNLKHGTMPDWHEFRRVVLPEAFRDGDRRALESILP